MKYNIYQINGERDVNRLMFIDYETCCKWMGTNEIDSEIYDFVYSGELPGMFKEFSLDDLYEQFNLHKPFDYRGRSMSVSDVIHIEDTNEFYFVDSVGFTKVPFDPAKTQIKCFDTIRVVMCEPGKKAYVTDIIADLKSYQNIVGGNIEVVHPNLDPVCIVCNEEGKVLGLPLNRAIKDNDGTMLDAIAGTFFVCDASRSDIGSLPVDMQDKYKKLFKYPEHFYKTGNEIQSVTYNPDRSGAR